MLMMAARRTSSRLIVAILACTTLATVSRAFAAESKPDSKPKAEPGPPPAVRIDVAPFGYMPPSKFYLAARLACATLDFIDSDHLLFTFREGGLIPRLPDDPPDDEDQIVRA